MGALRSFFGAHGRVLVILVVIGLYFTADIVPALAFNQRAASDGVRLETDREVYTTLSQVEIRIFLVNKLDHTMDITCSSRELTVTGMGLYFRVTVDPLCSSTSHRLISPGSELPAGRERSWVPLVPGPYTIEVVIRPFEDFETDFTGSTTVLIVPGPAL